jgi:hypothetical protein
MRKKKKKIGKNKRELKVNKLMKIYNKKCELKD